jgi:hypothetical protein
MREVPAHDESQPRWAWQNPRSLADSDPPLYFWCHYCDAWYPVRLSAEHQGGHPYRRKPGGQ